MEPASRPAPAAETWRGPVRAEQTLTQADVLRAEVDAWLAGWREADTRRQYHTQLTTLESVLTEALTGLRQQADALALQGATGEVYSACEATEQRLLWVRRVLWGYFQEKFDQRRAPAVSITLPEGNTQMLDPARVLRAADEVVWSCYAEAMAAAGEHDRSVKRQTTPLPYLEARFSPQAIPRIDPPGTLRERSIGSFAKTYLAELPIPIVSLPPWCVSEPWGLVFLAHEVGHHVQHDLRYVPQDPTSGYVLVEGFGKQVQQAAATAAGRPLTGDERARWYAWGQEIFADLFSVVMMGGSAARAMVELETVPAAFGHRHRDWYPSPLARLALLRGAVHTLEPAGSISPALPEPTVPADVPDADGVRAELAQAAAVGAALVDASLDGLGTLRGLGRWHAQDVTPEGEIGIWVRVLHDTKSMRKRQTRPAARHLVSAAVIQWARLAERYGARLAAADPGAADDARRELRRAQVHLADRLLEAIEANREAGTRAAEDKQAVVVAPIAQEMTNELLQINPFED